MLKGVLNKFLGSFLNRRAHTSEEQSGAIQELDASENEAIVKDWSSWKTLAETNKLYFKADSLMEEASVFGAYKGYSVKLTTSHHKNGSLVSEHTKLELTVGAVTHLITDDQTNPEKYLDNGDIRVLLDPDEIPFSLKGHVELSGYGGGIRYTQPQIEIDIGYLQFLLDFTYRVITAYPKIVSRGGEIIPSLVSIASDEDYPLHSLVAHLIRDVAYKSHPQDEQVFNFYCKKCLHLLVKHRLEFSWLDEITYFGCRACHQSNSFYEAQTVIAVFDSQMTNLVHKQGQTLRVNWLIHRALFDFDSLEIIQATDEDIERFVVQVGNDTDEDRCSRYSQMVCVISPECKLTTNTTRILERTFGDIVISS